MAQSNPINPKAALLRALPSVDQLLRTSEANSLRDMVGPARITSLARTIADDLRREIQENSTTKSYLQADPEKTRESLLAEAVRRLEVAGQKETLAGVRRVINATGVVLHTNLGRAPLSGAAREALGEAAGYCNLEYDISNGQRGRRGARVEDLLIELTGAEDALVVNNCAAAALLVLTVLARDGETIVSRGELVEIGGDFRVPDVMASSGTQMMEVGTTNRTKLDDYRKALNEKTRLLMRVHQSNYRIVGFTYAPSIAELSALAHESGVPLYEDAGSGALQDLGPYGLADEPVISESIANGADLVSFSGDKLLGACQAGLVVGRSDLVKRLRRHPLYRALRADKLSLSVLEATIESYSRGTSMAEVPVLRMLSLTQSEIEARTKNFIESYQKTGATGLEISTIEGHSAIGGGSGPNTHPSTVLMAIYDAERSADELAQALRESQPPIIGRITDGRVLLDLRTVATNEEADILKALVSIANKTS
jgi:L-seryl-tRNA(Ser) seleniumtransferase